MSESVGPNSRVKFPAMATFRRLKLSTIQHWKQNLCGDRLQRLSKWLPFCCDSRLSFAPAANTNSAANKWPIILSAFALKTNNIKIEVIISYVAQASRSTDRRYFLSRHHRVMAFARAVCVCVSLPTGFICSIFSYFWYILNGPASRHSPTDTFYSSLRPSTREILNTLSFILIAADYNNKNVKTWYLHHHHHQKRMRGMSDAGCPRCAVGS